MDNITMKINADNLIMMALREDVTSEDIYKLIRGNRYGE